jgi:predicted nuclease with TOPRIM domain
MESAHHVNKTEYLRDNELQRQCELQKTEVYEMRNKCDELTDEIVRLRTANELISASRTRLREKYDNLKSKQKAVSEKLKVQLMKFVGGHSASNSSTRLLNLRTSS